MSNKTASNSYLTFNGNCREAMTFYKSCLGGDLHIMNFEGTPMDVPAQAKNLVLHANLINEGIHLMASDAMPDKPVIIGNNISLSLNCESKEQANTFYAKLSSGGKQTMPMQHTFWGAWFGMLTDQFGVNWMFNFDEPKA
jgi:PhnB protein